MKYIIILGLCLVPFSHQSDKHGFKPDFYDIVEENSPECLKESNAKKEDLDDFLNEKVEANKEIKCYLKCVLEKMGIISADGVIDANELKAQLPDEYDQNKKDDVIQKCAKIQSENPCETAYLLAECCEDQMY